MFIKFLFIMLVLLIFDAGAGHDIRYDDEYDSKTIRERDYDPYSDQCTVTNACMNDPNNSEPTTTTRPKRFEPKNILNRKSFLKVLKNYLPPVDDTLEMEPAMFVFNYRLQKPVRELRQSNHV
ncbi:uncharacterized protein [Choristoneura fumiferana]|uniref:uncharacterized protein n=1 Tax=Choristoneura fumiferana TaxID=7141 RepID=UPI003D159719